MSNRYKNKKNQNKFSGFLGNNNMLFMIQSINYIKIIKKDIIIHNIKSNNIIYL
jgi:hypothetical protein